MAHKGERGGPIESPLEAAAGAAGPRATEAFAILANETRLSILLTLWEAYDPFAEDNAVPFSELRKRVGLRQGEQFNYHLTQLVGHFVRKTDDGYELRRAGHQLVQTVIAGAGIKEPELAPTEIDRDCYLCGAPTAVAYHDEVLFLFCTECDGLFGNRMSIRKECSRRRTSIRQASPIEVPKSCSMRPGRGACCNPRLEGCVMRARARWTAGCISVTTTRPRGCVRPAGGGMR